MRKKIIIVGILFIILTLGLSGCNEENSSRLDEERIVGTWIGSDIFQNNTRNITMIFLSNKTYETVATYNGYKITGKGTWKIFDNELFIDITEPKSSKSKSDYIFSNNFNTLTIIDSTGKSIDFTKQ